MAEDYGGGIAAMLAADAQLDVRPPLPAALDRQTHQSPNPFLIERGERVGIEDIVRRLAELEAAGPALQDRKSTRLNSSHIQKSRMPSSA